MKSFAFQLLVPEGMVFEGEVCSLSVPGSMGYFEILANHIAIIASLKEGKVKTSGKEQEKQSWQISGGFLKFSHNKAILLAERCEKTTAAPQTNVKSS